MELNVVNTVLAEGDQAYEILMMTQSSIGYKRSQDLEDSRRGRPTSPRYSPGDEAVAHEECVCSNPSSAIDARE